MYVLVNNLQRAENANNILRVDLQRKTEAIIHGRSRSKDISYLLEKASKYPRNDTLGSNTIDNSIDRFNTPINFLSNLNTQNISVQDNVRYNLLLKNVINLENSMMILCPYLLKKREVNKY